VVDLDGKVAIVTGASRGVGAATSVALAEAGCRVACAARSTKDAPQRTAGTLDETLDRVKAAGGEGLAVPTNLADREAVRAMVARTVDHFGGVDVLINNAAVQFIGDLEQPEHRHDLTFAVNYWAPYVAIKEAYPHMERRGGGSIVNVSSLAALIPFPDMLSYGASKVALERLTLDVARILRPLGDCRERLSHRHRCRIGGFRCEHTRGRPVRLGTVRGGSRRHPLDDPAAGRVHGAQGEHVPPPRARRDHGEPRSTRARRGTDADRALFRPLRVRTLDVRRTLRLSGAAFTNPIEPGTRFTLQVQDSWDNTVSGTMAITINP
jgi:NADP-dependent 3-hydroxy acid dehydrogenase YdfG